MRINVYAEELTHDVEIVTKSPANVPGETFAGVRMYLRSPEELHRDPTDDDRSAITIWVPWTKADGHRYEVVTRLLRLMADTVEHHYCPPLEQVASFNFVAVERRLSDIDPDLVAVLVRSIQRYGLAGVTSALEVVGRCG